MRKARPAERMLRQHVDKVVVIVATVDRDDASEEAHI